MKKKFLAACLVLLFSCSSSEPPTCVSVGKDEEHLSNEQRLLNHGYATIYGSFDSFKWLDRLLAIKMESQQVHDLVDDLHKEGKKITEKFDELKKKYPNLEVNETGRTEVSKVKAKSRAEDQFGGYLPIVGIKGKEFERSLLLFISNSTNELKYLSKTLEQFEPNPGLKAFNREIQRASIKFEDRALKLLNEKYFKENYFKPQEMPKN